MQLIITKNYDQIPSHFKPIATIIDLLPTMRLPSAQLVLHLIEIFPQQFKFALARHQNTFFRSLLLLFRVVVAREVTDLACL